MYNLKDFHLNTFNHHTRRRTIHLQLGLHIIFNYDFSWKQHLQLQNRFWNYKMIFLTITSCKQHPHFNLWANTNLV
jgi:hypothetical protein